MKSSFLTVQNTNYSDKHLAFPSVKFWDFVVNNLNIS